MDLSPNDIRNYDFSNQMRGYDKEEVTEFLTQISEILEKSRQENLKLSMEIDSLNGQLAGLRQFEETIKNAAIDARRNADMTVANAKKEADLILSQAQAEANNLVGSQAQRISEMKGQISRLEMTKKSFLSRVRDLINSHLEMVDEIAKDDIRRDLKDTSDDIHVTESADVTRPQIETVSAKSEESLGDITDEANAGGALSQVIPVEGDTEATASDQTEDILEGQTSHERAIDPELAAALESYQSQKAEDDQPEDIVVPSPEAVPRPGEVVETTARAEDIPPGFVAPKGESSESAVNDTDRVITDVAPDTQDDPTEHNSIDIDTDVAEPSRDSALAPDDLAAELDSVVAKFEEEMDKAEKS